MPLVELERASLGPSDSYHHGLKSSASDDHTFSSNMGKLNGVSEVRRSRSEELSHHHSAVKSAFTNFTESLSHSSEEFQDSVQKTFSSIASTFSRDQSSNATSSTTTSSVSDNNKNNNTGYGDESEFSSSSSSCTSSDKSRGGIPNKLTWSEFVFPDNLRSRISSLTSRSSSSCNSASGSSSGHEDSSLSSRSQSPRMNNGNGVAADQFSITVDSTGLVLREGCSEDDTHSSADCSSVASWQETASRDRSLLDTIGESRDEDDDDDDDDNSSSSSSGSEESGSDRGDDDDEIEEEGQEIGEDGIVYDYEDDHTEFDSDVGLEELGAVMLQYGSCQFEPESASFDDEDYYYQSESFLQGGRGNEADGEAGTTSDQTYSEADRNAAFQKQLKQRQSAEKQPKKNESIAALFTKAFSCGTGAY